MLKFGRQNTPDTSAPVRGSRRGTRGEDPAADLKRKARQRLIGAVVLVLTAIIVVPMVLDSEPRPLGQDIAITIPGKDTPFVPKMDAPAKAGEGAAAPGPAPAPSAPAAPVAPEPASSPATPPTAAPGSAAAPVTTAPAATKGPTPPAAGSAAHDASKGEGAKPEPGKGSDKPGSAVPAAVKAGDGDRALALLEGKPAADSKPVANGKFYVQIGAFATGAKAKELQARLKSAGVATFTEAVRTGAGERIRLRAGPYATRADAEAALGKIKAAGYAGAAVVQ